MKNIDKFRIGFQTAQEKKGYTFNKDDSRVNNIIEGLIKNMDRYGYMSCPCRLASGDREADEPITCPCIYREDDVRDYGTCYCSLFVNSKKKEADLTGVKVPDKHVYKY